MTTTSRQFVTRADRPVDALLLDILRRVDAVARDLAIDYFVGGALARDLILLHVFGKDTGRATRDVDLGICIDSWAGLEDLRAHLIEGGHFSQQPDVVHRLIYRQSVSAFGVPLDLLPFGGVENSDRTISWPPGMDIVMNVSGFAEARASALGVKIADDFVVPVTSLPALAALKLIAWRDRHLETSKDATDFLVIARHYADAGNIDRLYETESAVLQAVDFDLELAGAMLLGKDAGAVSSTGTFQIIDDVLTSLTLRQRLLDQLLRTTLIARDDAGSSRVGAILDAFQSGLEQQAANR